MKKLLIITRWYLPAVKSGGTVRSISALAKGLNSDFDLTILTSDRDLGAKEPYKNVKFDELTFYENIPIIYLSKLKLAPIYKHIKEISPDIIYINSFFDITTQIIMFLKLQGKIKSKIILAPRGELADGALSIKAKKKSIYIRLYKLFNLSKNIIFHATSKDDLSDIKNKFPDNEVVLIPNPKEEDKTEYSLPYKEINKLRIVFISRIAPVKNLLFALNILDSRDIKEDIIFDIYGPDEDIEYWNICKEKINRLPKNIEVNYRGFVNPSDIGITLSKYHLFFLPTKGENFGHAIVEAMQVGLIPLISDKTPWQDLENLKVGFSLSLDNPNKFLKAIKEIVSIDNSQFIDYSNNIKEYISKKLDNRKTIEEYKKIFNT